MVRRRLAPSFVLAATVHALALALALRIVPRPTTLPESPPQDPIAIETLPAPEPVPVPDPSNAETQNPETQNPEAHNPETPTPKSPTPKSPTSDPPATAQADVPPTPPAEDSAQANLPRPDTANWQAPGLRDSPASREAAAVERFGRMRTTSAAEEAKEASERATRVLADATMAHDVAIGFTSGGPILTALASEATRTITPVIGRATFEATSNAAGDVLTLDVVSASTGLEEWRNAARAALLALAGKRIRASGRGRVVRMEIQSKWQLPSGRDPGVDIELLGRTLKKGGTGKTSAALKILDPIPKLTTLTLPDGTKLNVPQITFTIIGTDIDPADIDATPRRVVNGRVIDEHGL